MIKKRFMQKFNSGLRNRIDKSTLYIFLYRLLPAIVAFSLTPFLLTNMGTSNYSLFAIANVLISLGNFLDFGIIQSKFPVFLNAYQIQNRSEATNVFRNIKTSLFRRSTILTCVCFLSYLLASHLNFLRINFLFKFDFASLVILAVFIPMTPLINLVTQCYTSVGRKIYILKINSMNLITMNILITILVIFRLPFSLVISCLVSPIILSFFQLLFFGKKYLANGIHPKIEGDMKEVESGLNSFITQIYLLFVVYSDIFFVANLENNDLTSKYALISKIALFFYSFYVWLTLENWHAYIKEINEKGIYVAWSKYFSFFSKMNVKIYVWSLSTCLPLMWILNILSNRIISFNLLDSFVAVNWFLSLILQLEIVRFSNSYRDQFHLRNIFVSAILLNFVLKFFFIETIKSEHSPMLATIITILVLAFSVNRKNKSI